MVSASEAFKRVINCPKLILTGAIFGFLYSMIDNYNPIPGVIMGFSGLGGDFLGTILAAVSAFLAPAAFFKGLFFLMVAVLAVALIGGLFMSGYMQTLKLVAISGSKGKGAFSEGVRRNFGRSFRGSILFFLSFILISIVTVIALLPAMTTMWAAFHGKGEIMPVAFFITVLSIFAVFFILLFYNVYTAFWYPAISMGYIKFARVSKRVIDGYFFDVAGKVFRYTLEFIFITLLCILARYFFSGVFQKLPGLAILLVIEGSLISLWFLRLTNYVTITFAALTEKYRS